MASRPCRISSGIKQDCKGLASLLYLGLFAAFWKCEEATGKVQTWPTVLTLNSLTWGILREWDSCQTLPLRTHSSGLRQPQMPLPTTSLLLQCQILPTATAPQTIGIYPYLHAQSRHSLAKCIFLQPHIPKGNTEMSYTVSSPKSRTEKQAERGVSTAHVVMMRKDT